MMENEKLPKTTTTTTNSSSDRSDEVVSKTVNAGMEKIAISTTVGLALGIMAGIVLTRGGKSGSAARKIISGFGAGAGLGSAWTRTSIELEDTLQQQPPQPPTPPPLRQQ